MVAVQTERFNAVLTNI